VLERLKNRLPSVNIVEMVCEYQSGGGRSFTAKPVEVTNNVLINSQICVIC
jgi:hypothetical protein